MHIIDCIAKPTPQEASAMIDKVALTWERRQRSRQRLLTLQGRAIALPLEIDGEDLKTLYEPVLETSLGRQDSPVEHTQLPFTPVSATSEHRHT
jgi:urease accessory protein UreE